MTKYIEEQRKKYGLKEFDNEGVVTMAVVVPKKLEQRMIKIAEANKITKSAFMRVAFWNEVERWQA